MVFEMKHITKAYGPVLANDDVSLHLNAGEILAVVGENGAGKSTIMKILYGLEQPDTGEIYVGGRLQHFRSPRDAMAAGIGMVQQHFMLFEPMTVAENIVFKNEVRRGPFIDKAKTLETVRALSERYGLRIDPEARIADCPVGLRQRVEILKILYQNAEIIIFDEPSAVLTPLEVEALLDTLRSLAAAGKSVVLITHKLQEVMAVADRVTVMRQGHVVAERLVGETDINELAVLMVGHPLASYDIGAPCPGKTLLETRGLCLAEEGRDVLRDISLHVSAGEIVGIAGVSGNGQSDLVGCITGLRKPSGGQVLVCGSDVTGRSVRDVRDAGLAHIPEDRFVWGSAPEGSLEDNTLMGRQDEEPFSHRGIISRNAIRAYGERLVSNFSVKAASVTQKMRELSGGNAQKLIVAREMSLNTPVIICCEPTRGIDIGAMESIHRRLLDRRKDGAAILLVSSELSEIMSLSDRIYVIFEGKLVGEFTRGSIDDRRLGLLMVGGRLNDEAQ